MNTQVYLENEAEGLMFAEGQDFFPHSFDFLPEGCEITVNGFISFDETSINSMIILGTELSDEQMNAIIELIGEDKIVEALEEAAGLYDYESDGQPTEWEEWQNVYGGDEDPPTSIDDYDL